MIQARYIEGSITSSSADAFSLYERSRFGEKKNSLVEYSLLEALFLLKQEKLALYIGSHPLSFESALQRFKRKDKKLLTKLAVFSDIRQKGYITKTALKFGAEFRVYEKGVKPSEDHARWLVHTTQSHDSLHWHELAAKSRVAHTTRKKLLIAIVDEDGDISYYEVSWLRL